MIKIKSGSLVFFIIILLQLSLEGHGDRIKDKMYADISSIGACFRRLNGTHQIGCSSQRGGSTGVIHFCQAEKDLEEIIAQGTGQQYIPILPTKIFNPVTLHQMINSNKISGLIIYSSNDTLKNFTHENQCPNPQSSIAGTCKKESVWNPWGTGILYQDIPFPIFFVAQTKDIEVIKDCFSRFNNYSYQNHADRSLCSLELNSFMYATTDTPTCLRRSSIVTNVNPQIFCDPLGDSNVWASLYPLVEGPKNETKPIKDNKYIIIAARLDTTSMFDVVHGGANSPITGIVTLLSLAKYLKDIIKIDDIKAAKKNVLFFLFNGETYDYIGSQRILYDMLNGDFPIPQAEKSTVLPEITPKDVDLYIEISQIGNADQIVYAHYLNEAQSVSSYIDLLLNSNSSNVSFQKLSGSLPPASLHTFIKKISTFPGLIISDHKTSYSNHYFNSIYDNSSNIRFQYYNFTKNEVIPKESLQYLIKNVTEVLGNSIFSYITKRNYNGDGVDAILVNELLYCYLENPTCKVHQAVDKDLNLPSYPLNFYVGVKRVDTIARVVAGLTLGWFTGDVVGEGYINCTNKPRNYAFKYYNMSESIYDLDKMMCYQITMNATDALSPAFTIKDYDWSSGQYSSWTESIWRDTNVRMFLRPSASQERMSVAIGSVVLVFSFLVVYFIKSKSNVLFTPLIPTEAPTDC